MGQGAKKLTEYQINEICCAESLFVMCMTLPVFIDGKPIDFKTWPHQKEIFRDMHPDQTHQKAAQMGASMTAIIKSIHHANYIFPHGVLYLIPTKTDVMDFSRKKFSKVLEENPVFRSWISEAPTTTDSAGLKKVGKSHIIFRGMGTSTGLKVQDVDMIVYDELEEASEYSKSLAEKRVSASDYKWKYRLSVPSDLGVGINYHFQRGDQRYWLIKCLGCNEWVCMEEEFPNCVLDIGGRVIRCCPKCQKELDITKGEWVAKRPDITDRRSYQISELWSPKVTAEELLEEYRTTKNMAWFYNNTLGLPYTDVAARLSVEQVLTLCGEELMLEKDDGPCMMGVDPGKIHHVVIGKKLSERKVKIIRIGVVNELISDMEEKINPWDMLAKIIKRYNVTCCVIDGRPYIDDARRLARNLPGKVYLYFHSESQKGIALWKDKDWAVNINACEAMDNSHNMLLEKRVMLPRRSNLIEIFAKHCHSVGRKLEEDEETGDRRYWWKKLGEDHFRRAFNLMVLGMERTGIAKKKKKSLWSRLSGTNQKQMEGYG